MRRWIKRRSAPAAAVVAAAATANGAAAGAPQPASRNFLAPIKPSAASSAEVTKLLQTAAASKAGGNGSALLTVIETIDETSKNSLDLASNAPVELETKLDLINAAVVEGMTQTNHSVKELKTRKAEKQKIDSHIDTEAATLEQERSSLVNLEQEHTTHTNTCSKKSTELDMRLQSMAKAQAAMKLLIKEFKDTQKQLASKVSIIDQQKKQAAAAQKKQFQAQSLTSENGNFSLTTNTEKELKDQLNASFLQLANEAHAHLKAAENLRDADIDEDEADFQAKASVGLAEQVSTVVKDSVKEYQPRAISSTISVFSNISQEIRSEITELNKQKTALAGRCDIVGDTLQHSINEYRTYKIPTLQKSLQDKRSEAAKLASQIERLTGDINSLNAQVSDQMQVACTDTQTTLGILSGVTNEYRAIEGMLPFLEQAMSGSSDVTPAQAKSIQAAVARASHSNHAFKGCSKNWTKCLASLNVQLDHLFYGSDPLCKQEYGGQCCTLRWNNEDQVDTHDADQSPFSLLQVLVSAVPPRGTNFLQLGSESTSGSEKSFGGNSELEAQLASDLADGDDSYEEEDAVVDPAAGQAEPEAQKVLLQLQRLEDARARLEDNLHEEDEQLQNSKSSSLVTSMRRNDAGMIALLDLQMQNKITSVRAQLRQLQSTATSKNSTRQTKEAAKKQMLSLLQTELNKKTDTQSNLSESVQQILALLKNALANTEASLDKNTKKQQWCKDNTQYTKTQKIAQRLAISSLKTAIAKDTLDRRDNQERLVQIAQEIKDAKSNYSAAQTSLASATQDWSAAGGRKDDIQKQIEMFQKVKNEIKRYEAQLERDGLSAKNTRQQVSNIDEHLEKNGVYRNQAASEKTLSTKDTLAQDRYANAGSKEVNDLLGSRMQGYQSGLAGSGGLIMMIENMVTTSINALTMEEETYNNLKLQEEKTMEHATSTEASLLAEKGNVSVAIDELARNIQDNQGMLVETQEQLAGTKKLINQIDAACTTQTVSKEELEDTFNQRKAQVKAVEEALGILRGLKDEIGYDVSGISLD